MQTAPTPSERVLLNARTFAPVKRPWGSAVIAAGILAVGTVVTLFCAAVLLEDLVDPASGAGLELLWPIGFGILMIVLGVGLLRHLLPLLRTKAD